MSGIESSVMTPAASTDDDSSNKMFFGLLVIAGILLLAILLTEAGVIGASHGSDGGNGGGGDADDDNGKGPSFVQGGKPPPPATTTKKYVRKTTREVITTSPTPDQFVMNPTPKVWPARPTAGSQNDTLLCVVGQIQNTPVHKPKFPDDGLCDYTFYAHLVYSNGEFRGKDNKFTWDNFKAIASQSVKTGYGFSINYANAKDFKEAVFGSGNKKNEIKTFFDSNKIRHYGFLEAMDNDYSLNRSANTADGIKQLKEFLSLAISWRGTNTQIAVGVRFASYEATTFASKGAVLKNIASQTGATIVVLHTHVASYVKDESALCMTSWTYIKGRTKQPTLKDVGTDILARAALPGSVTVMISFTLSAQIFRSSSTYHSEKSNFKAAGFGLLPYSQMCIANIPHQDKDANAEVFISSFSSTYSVCAERSETIISKVKKWLLVVNPQKHGFAFFDVELDDLADTCRKGLFHRIDQVKRYLRS